MLSLGLRERSRSLGCFILGLFRSAFVLLCVEPATDASGNSCFVCVCARVCTRNASIGFHRRGATLQGTPSFLQDTTLHSHNSIHTTLHGPILHTRNSVRHNSTRHNSTRNNWTRHISTLYNSTLHTSIRQNLTRHISTRHNSTRPNPTCHNLIRHNYTRHNSTQLQLDTTRFDTTITGHGLTPHDHNSTRHNSTRPQLDMSQLYTDHMAVRLSLP